MWPAHALECWTCCFSAQPAPGQSDAQARLAAAKAKRQALKQEEVKQPEVAVRE